MPDPSASWRAIASCTADLADFVMAHEGDVGEGDPGLDPGGDVAVGLGDDREVAELRPLLVVDQEPRR